MKKVVWLAVIAALVLGLAWPKLKPVAGTAAAKIAESSGRRKEDVLQVATMQVEPQAFVETLTSTGTLRAEEGVELQAETSGKVVTITFEEGMPVRRGELLLKLNDADLRANLERYAYGRQLAEAREKRYSTLLEQHVVTRQDYDLALGELNVQKANVDLYKAQIEKTEIRAPFDGVVGLRYVSSGAYVNAATRIATLQRLDKLKIDFAVPEKYSGRVKVGRGIDFSVAGGLRRYSGRIYAIDPRIDSGTRTILLRAVCDNSDRSLLPGAFANVTLALDQIPDALLVPAEAVIPGLDEKNVFIAKDGVAERRAVETGARTASQVHILSGLRPGDVVITSGLQNLRQGQHVASMHEPERVAGT
jgi:membrane fusion protein, multidrug efflux system